MRRPRRDALTRRPMSLAHNQSQRRDPALAQRQPRCAAVGRVGPRVVRRCRIPAPRGSGGVPLRPRKAHPPTRRLHNPRCEQRGPATTSRHLLRRAACHTTPHVPLTLPCAPCGGRRSMRWRRSSADPCGNSPALRTPRGKRTGPTGDLATGCRSHPASLRAQAILPVYAMATRI